MLTRLLQHREALVESSLPAQISITLIHLKTLSHPGHGTNLNHGLHWWFNLPHSQHDSIHHFHMGDKHTNKNAVQEGGSRGVRFAHTSQVFILGPVCNVAALWYTLPQVPDPCHNSQPCVLLTSLVLFPVTFLSFNCCEVKKNNVTFIFD